MTDQRPAQPSDAEVLHAIEVLIACEDTRTASIAAQALRPDLKQIIELQRAADGCVRLSRVVALRRLRAA